MIEVLRFAFRRTISWRLYANMPVKLHQTITNHHSCLLPPQHDLACAISPLPYLFSDRPPTHAIHSISVPIYLVKVMKYLTVSILYVRYRRTHDSKRPRNRWKRLAFYIRPIPRILDLVRNQWKLITCQVFGRPQLLAFQIDLHLRTLHLNQEVLSYFVCTALAVFHQIQCVLINKHVDLS